MRPALVQLSLVLVGVVIVVFLGVLSDGVLGLREAVSGILASLVLDAAIIGDDVRGVGRRAAAAQLGRRDVGQHDRQDIAEREEG